MDVPHRTINLDDIQSLNTAISEINTKEWKRYHCQLVTPMFGGGAKAGEVDTQMAIRASSIRGQLRFWWRLAFGKGLSSEKIFEKEKNIWGGISASGATKSQVDIRVEYQHQQENLVPYKNYKINKGIEYAFGCSSIGSNAKWLKEGVEFTLLLRYPNEVASEVQQTLRLWASIGGLGGRTRRGFGALAIKFDDKILPPITQKEFEAFGGQLAFLSQKHQSAIAAWGKAVTKLYAFRQQPGIGRNKKNNNTPGRSFWPEPDAIRRIVNLKGGKHRPEHLAGNVFPRAAFGLPIAFKFKGEQEPRAHTLSPTDHNRMASPLIIRPYWNGNKWTAVALILPGTEERLKQLTLTLKENKGHKTYRPNYWPSNAEEQKKLASSIPPMENRGIDPLSAFLEYFKGK